MPNAPTTVEVVEVGPRDGLQNERLTLPVDARVELVTRLLDHGVRRIEAVSFVRADRVPQMAGAEEVMAALPRRDDVTYVGLVLTRRGAERAAAAGCDEINVVVPVTDAFALRNQGAPVDVLLRHAADSVGVARQAGQSVSVTLAVAFGCPFSGEVPLERAREVLDRVLDLGLDEIAFADTIGVGVPSQVMALGGLVQDDPRASRLRFHFHDTRHTGYANAWAATGLDLSRLGGTVALDASVGGFGGCPFAPGASGNVATEDLVHLLQRDGARLTAPLDVAGLVDVGAWLAPQVGRPVDAALGRAGAFPPALQRVP